MPYKITEIEGIGPRSRQKLASAGIRSTDDLLELCCTAKGRRAISGKTGLSEKHILTWTNMADLMRVSGIGRQYAGLLEAAGVETLKELRHRDAETLASKLYDVNQEKKLTRNPPSISVVTDWINQARYTNPRISH